MEIVPFSLATVELQSNCLQGLGALPQELVTRILRASSIPLAEQLRLLPRTFHTAAVHAAFPTIDADRSIDVDASDLQHAWFVEALWLAISRITCFRTSSEECYDPWLARFSYTAATALGSQLAKLSCIQKLNLSHKCLCDAGVEVLGPHLAQLTSIQHVDLRGNRLSLIHI